MKPKSFKKNFPKIGLALGSGAARGFCHIGVLKVLEANGIPIHCITGCSMGAIIGGGYAAGHSIAEMEQLAAGMTQHLIRDFGVGFHRQGMFKGERVMAVLEELLGEKKIEDCAIPFAAIATEIRQNRLHTFKSGLLTEAMRASMSIPGVFTYAENSQGRFIDGGVLERIPVTAARELGAEFVIGVDALGPPDSKYYHESGGINGMLDMIERAYLIIDWQAQKQRVTTEPDFLITPDQQGRSMYKFNDNVGAINDGIKAAIAALPEILRKFPNA